MDISEVWRYPVKSMLGERRDDAMLTASGIAGDRAYAVIDRSDGKVASAKNPRKWRALLNCHAEFLEDPVAGEAPPPARITLPDGTVVTSDDPSVHDVLSTFLGRDVDVGRRRPRRRAARGDVARCRGHGSGGVHRQHPRSLGRERGRQRRCPRSRGGSGLVLRSGAGSPGDVVEPRRAEPAPARQPVRPATVSAQRRHRCAGWRLRRERLGRVDPSHGRRCKRQRDDADDALRHDHAGARRSARRPSGPAHRHGPQPSRDQRARPLGVRSARTRPSCRPGPFASEMPSRSRRNGLFGLLIRGAERPTEAEMVGAFRTRFRSARWAGRRACSCWRGPSA